MLASKVKVQATNREKRIVAIAQPIGVRFAETSAKRRRVQFAIVWCAAQCGGVRICVHVFVSNGNQRSFTKCGEKVCGRRPSRLTASAVRNSVVAKV